mgnify:CR=1 FL=1
MFVSMNWIKDFVNLDGWDLDQLIHRFTLSTAEVEGIEYKGKDVKDVVVGEILSCEDHPDSDHLHLFFNTGVFAIVVVGVIYLCITVKYCVSCVKLKNKS